MSGPHDVLVIEDDPVLGGALTQRLELEGTAVRWARTCAEAMTELRRLRPSFVVADIRLPDGSGEDLYRQALPYLGRTPIVFATAYAEVDQAVRLVRAGADDYLTKPYDVDALVARICAALAQAGTEVAESTQPRPFGRSEATLRLASDLERVARTDLPVLLLGETGVGKEVAARHLHASSAQSDHPFVPVNCGAIPSELMESQFFGHERGAFTGAVAAHVGYFEEAGNGTLFLDEIGELDAKLQAALLRVLNDGEFRRIGGRSPIRFRGRIVAATNADLQELIAARAFREDLYYRLAVVELRIPPLRERPAEVLPLADALAAEAAARAGRERLVLDGSARAAMLGHPWHGNLRELRNRLERAAALTDGEVIGATDLFPERRLDQPATATLADARDRAELDQIERAMTLSGGRVSEAARQLGISRTTLWKRRKRQADG